MDSLHQPQAGLPFIKAHGTGNDFVVIDAVTHDINVSADDVAAICDRHMGIGADGLIRVSFAVEHGVTDAKYFMDYRNADGTLAETCGNGLRVAARYLVEHGLESRGTFSIGTRAGTVMATVRADDHDFDDIAIRMGVPEMSRLRAMPVVATETGTWNGVAVFMPNPHCVVEVTDSAAAGSLDRAPQISPDSVFPAGANVEFIVGQSAQHISMRTYERGVGETLSCGSGACAAAYAWSVQHNNPVNWSVQVDVLGGTVHVDCDDSGVLTLRGPARVIARGQLMSGNVESTS